MSFPQMTEQFSYCVSRRDLSTIKRQKVSNFLSSNTMY